ncbi:unnamed protein product [Blepharisma stoltei]|uniref:Uncharacterized protein n=1 Tax=Blepharisma stoltei TaxID=1481888 RepID=A0AAU9KAF6_9CILI|nr:unnamed protein product [Blepharisma stoltei]
MIPKHPLTLTQAENNHLLQENRTLKKQFTQLHRQAQCQEFEDLALVLTVLELQRERIHFLRQELSFLEDRQEQLNLDIRKADHGIRNEQQDTNENLELRLEIARKRKKELEDQLRSFNSKFSKEIAEMKIKTAKQRAELLSSLKFI